MMRWVIIGAPFLQQLEDASSAAADPHAVLLVRLPRLLAFGGGLLWALERAGLGFGPTRFRARFSIGRHSVLPWALAGVILGSLLWEAAVYGIQPAIVFVLCVPLVWVGIGVSLLLAGCAGQDDDGDDKPPPVPEPQPEPEPQPPGSGSTTTQLHARDHDRFRTGVNGTDQPTDVEIVDVGTNNPGVTVRVRGLPANRFKWMQIVKNTDNNGSKTRPNFDGPPTKGEEQSMPGARQLRDQLKAAHDPFDHGSSHSGTHLPPGFFDDYPTPGQFGYFEAYTILCVLDVETGPPPRWRARVARVYHWVWRTGQNGRMEQVSSTDSGLQSALNGAMSDFDGGFAFDTWYNGSPP